MWGLFSDGHMIRKLIIILLKQTEASREKGINSLEELGQQGKVLKTKKCQHPPSSSLHPVLQVWTTNSRREASWN